MLRYTNTSSCIALDLPTAAEIPLNYVNRMGYGKASCVTAAMNEAKWRSSATRHDGIGLMVEVTNALNDKAQIRRDLSDRRQ